MPSDLRHGVTGSCLDTSKPQWQEVMQFEAERDTLVFQIPPELRCLIGMFLGSSHTSSRLVFGSLGMGM